MPQLANRSMLRGWHFRSSLYEFALSQYKKIGRRPMFDHWTVDAAMLSGRIFFPQPAIWFSNTTLQDQWRLLDFPSRPLKKKPTSDDLDTFAAAKTELRSVAATAQAKAPAGQAAFQGRLPVSAQITEHTPDPEPILTQITHSGSFVLSVSPFV